MGASRRVRDTPYLRVDVVRPCASRSPASVTATRPSAPDFLNRVAQQLLRTTFQCSMQMWTRNKRALSESDCEDLYQDDHSKEYVFSLPPNQTLSNLSFNCFNSCSSPGEGLNDSCSASGSGGMTRKRRRGIIEKRRRDRINHSLSELRRLVPSAYEKQGSAKLEKAEILQLTVDHLKMLHTKGKHRQIQR